MEGLSALSDFYHTHHIPVIPLHQTLLVTDSHFRVIANVPRESCVKSIVCPRENTESANGWYLPWTGSLTQGVSLSILQLVRNRILKNTKVGQNNLQSRFIPPRGPYDGYSSHLTVIDYNDSAAEVSGVIRL